MKTNLPLLTAGMFAGIFLTALANGFAQITFTKITSGDIVTDVGLFNSVYCFGFSWTDTQGLRSDGSPDFANNNPQYWQNRTSNGQMWPEFLSVNLGLVYTAANNFARGAATSSDTLAQVNKLPSRSNPESGLYIVWVA